MEGGEAWPRAHALLVPRLTLGPGWWSQHANSALPVPPSFYEQTPSNIRQSWKSFTVNTRVSPQVLLQTLSSGCFMTQRLSTPFHPSVLSLFLTHFKENCKHLYL